MALYLRTHPRKYVYAFITSRPLSHCYLHSEDKVADVLDNFTTHLMQAKCNKWRNLLNRTKLLRNTEPVQFQKANVLVDSLSDSRLNSETSRAIEDGDMQCLDDLVRQFSRFQRLPSMPVLLRVLWLYFQAGDIDGIECLSRVYADIDSASAKDNASFDDFAAGAIWISGDITKAIHMYENVYRNNSILRSRIRMALKFLISDSIDKRSEAALIIVLKFVKKLANEFDDYLPMSYLWQACFLSQWYSDQCFALQLLKDQLNLLRPLSNRIPGVISLALAKHQKDVAYRLLELFLAHDLVECYGTVLIPLFDYESKYKQQCHDIININCFDVSCLFTHKDR